MFVFMLSAISLSESLATPKSLLAKNASTLFKSFSVLKFDKVSVRSEANVKETVLNILIIEIYQSLIRDKDIKIEIRS